LVRTRRFAYWEPTGTVAHLYMKCWWLSACESASSSVAVSISESDAYRRMNTLPAALSQPRPSVAAADRMCVASCWMDHHGWRCSLILLPPRRPLVLRTGSRASNVSGQSNRSWSAYVRLPADRTSECSGGSDEVCSKFASRFGVKTTYEFVNSSSA
jgi:hypothetical protein